MQSKPEIIKTYIINLKRKPERRIMMQVELDTIQSAAYDLNPEFYEAIDGRNYDINRYIQEFGIKVPYWYNLQTGKAMTMGEIGCALSHFNIWCQAKTILADSDTDLVLILEDDVRFITGFVTRLNEILQNVTGYDLIYLGRDTCEQDLEREIAPQISTVAYSYGAHAYALTRKGAELLSNDMFLSNLLPTDDYLALRFGHPSRLLPETFRKAYQVLPVIQTCAVKPIMITLVNTRDSDTYFSMASALEKASKLTLYADWGDELDTTNAAARLRKYCITYGIFYTRNLSENQGFVIHTKTPYMIVIASPDEIIEKASKFALGGCVTDRSRSIQIYELRSKVTFVVDSENSILQLADPNDIIIKRRDNRIINKRGFKPCIVFVDDNDESYNLLNRIENFTGSNWNDYYGYHWVPGTVPDILPKIYRAVNVKMVSRIANGMITYPQNSIKTSLGHINRPDLPWIRNYASLSAFLDATLKEFLTLDTEYYFYVDTQHTITNPEILQRLIQYDRDVIAPIMCDDNNKIRNFSCPDAHEITDKPMPGIWNVENVSGIVLMQRKAATILIEYVQNNEIQDFSDICSHFRMMGIFIYAVNLEKFGYY